jgi:hypothetical protein
VRTLSDRAAAAGAAVYTETANPAAAGFYRRNGFVALCERSLPAAPEVVYRRFLRTPG